MPFASSDEAKRFLIDKIRARAVAEDWPLSADELALLESSAAPGPRADGGYFGQADERVEFLMGRVAPLLRHACELDGSADASQGQLYWDAVAALARDERDLRLAARAAGIVVAWPAWLRSVVAVAAFVFLVLPAVGAFLVATVGVWSAREAKSAWEAA